MPILKDAKSKGQRAHIAVDKLYIEGKLYQDAANNPGSTDNRTASTTNSSGTKTTNSVPQPGGARGFNVLPNEEEA